MRQSDTGFILSINLSLLHFNQALAQRVGLASVTEVTQDI